ncbi:hypothetical protein ACJX0J_016088, partial [Zea mays]
WGFGPDREVVLLDELILSPSKKENISNQRFNDHIKCLGEYIVALLRGAIVVLYLRDMRIIHGYKPPMIAPSANFVRWFLQGTTYNY